METLILFIAFIVFLMGVARIGDKKNEEIQETLDEWERRIKEVMEEYDAKYKDK